MLVVNLLNGPGAGKSTTAAGLFYQLKLEGINVELVTEFAKDLTWENRYEALSDQIYVTAKQNHRLERLRGKVDIVITDAPLLQGIHYMSPKNYLYKTYVPLVIELFNSYNNINFIIPRKLVYMSIGRSQTRDEAVQIDEDISVMLLGLKIRHTILCCSPEDTVKNILRVIGNV